MLKAEIEMVREMIKEEINSLEKRILAKMPKPAKKTSTKKKGK